MITYRYDAYGNTTKSNNTVNNPYQYNAEYTDSSTGLQYLRARYYDSSQGRFTAKDTYLGTIPNPLSRNLYTYVENNPLNFVDPSGHAKIARPLVSVKKSIKASVSNVTTTVKKKANVTINKAKYIAVSHSPNATSAEKSKAFATYMQSKIDLAMHMTIKKLCSTTDRIKITSGTNPSFRDNVKNKTGIDVYALGNAGLSLVGAVGSAAAMGVGILAAPETGGASLALTAFGAGSLTFACSDFQQYFDDIYVGKDGEYRHGTENRSYNSVYDGLFKGNDNLYNNVRTFTDLGTMIFGVGTAVATAPKTPAQKIKDVAGKNVGSSNSVLKNSPKTQESVNNKLNNYLLNENHQTGASKAKWFNEALGFNKTNMDDLAKQIVFNPNTAVQTGITEYGVKYNQVISITGSNGRVIDVTFAWIKNNDDVVRLVTAIPTKR